MERRLAADMPDFSRIACERVRARCKELALRALSRSAILLFCIAALIGLPHAAVADETPLPPGKLPVEISAGFFLANLSGATERNETFEADLYLNFRWRDRRLAFAGTEPKWFLEDAAIDQLKQMWRPQLEFVNTGPPTSPTARSPSGQMARSTTGWR